MAEKSQSLHCCRTAARPTAATAAPVAHTKLTFNWFKKSDARELQIKTIKRVFNYAN